MYKTTSSKSALRGYAADAPENMKKGKTKVVDKTGRGQPDVDTVPAMLAEGEAVLNVGAAERMGRDNIKQLNAQGLRDMGMDDRKMPVMKKGGRLGAYKGVEMAYRKGTECAGMRGYREGTGFVNSDAAGFVSTGSIGGGKTPAGMQVPTPYPGYGGMRVESGFAMGTEDVAAPPTLPTDSTQVMRFMGGTDKVMKMPVKMRGYAEGTADAGGHGTPDSGEAVNMAGTPGGRGRNIGAKFAGLRGYAEGTDDVDFDEVGTNIGELPDADSAITAASRSAARMAPITSQTFDENNRGVGPGLARDRMTSTGFKGFVSTPSPVSSGFRESSFNQPVRFFAEGVDRVPGESSAEKDSFDRFRMRNLLNESTPAGNLVENEPAGDVASVSPSRDVARLRQMSGVPGFAKGTEMVYAAEGDENIVSRLRNVGSRAVSGLRGMMGGGGAQIDLGTVGGTASAAPAAPAAPATPAATAAAPAAPAATSAAAADVASKQAAAAQSARMAMGESAKVAASGLRGGAGMPAAAAAAAAPAAPAAPAAAAPAAGQGAAFEAGRAVGRAGSGLRGAGVGAVPIVGGALSAGQALSEMPTGFFNDPNVPTMDKALQAGRSLSRAALPFIGGAIGSGVAPVLGTTAGAGLGVAAASQIAPEGEALQRWRAANQPAAPAAGAAPATTAAVPGAAVRQPRVASAMGGEPQAAAPQPGAPAGLRSAGRPDAEIFGPQLVRGTELSYPLFDYRNASNDQLRALATELMMNGSPAQVKKAESVVKDLTTRELQTERISADASKAAAAAALRSLGGGGGGGGGAAAAGGKTGVQDMKFFDRPTIDPKTGQTTPGKERPDLKEAFDGEYLPQFAAQLGKRPNQLEPTEQAQALVSFNLNRAAQDYALRSGKGFDFTMPVDLNKIQFVKDLPMLSRIVGRARGEATWREGFWDNGGIVITDGRETQEIPIDFLEESGALSDPAMSQLIKSLKARSRGK